LIQSYDLKSNDDGMNGYGLILTHPDACDGVILISLRRQHLQLAVTSTRVPVSESRRGHVCRPAFCILFWWYLSSYNAREILFNIM